MLKILSKIIMRIFTDEYGKNMWISADSCYRYRNNTIANVADSLGLYLEGFKIIKTGELCIYSYRRRKMVFLFGVRDVYVRILETNEKCKVIKWLKREISNEDSFERIKEPLEYNLSKFFQCTLKQDFWKIAKIIWIGHYKEPISAVNMLPKDMITVILKMVFLSMAQVH